MSPFNTIGTGSNLCLFDTPTLAIDPSYTSTGLFFSTVQGVQSVTVKTVADGKPSYEKLIRRARYLAEAISGHLTLFTQSTTVPCTVVLEIPVIMSPMSSALYGLSFLIVERLHNDHPLAVIYTVNPNVVRSLCVQGGVHSKRVSDRKALAHTLVPRWEAVKGTTIDEATAALLFYAHTQGRSTPLTV